MCPCSTLFDPNSFFFFIIVAHYCVLCIAIYTRTSLLMTQFQVHTLFKYVHKYSYFWFLNKLTWLMLGLNKYIGIILFLLPLLK